jgi:hypothetical protein
VWQLPHSALPIELRATTVLLARLQYKPTSERARIEAENSPIVRQLRELYEGGAEIEELRKLDPNAR